MEKLLKKLNNAGVALLETISVEETYAAVVGEALKLIGAQYGAIIIEKEDSQLKPVFVSDQRLKKLKIVEDGIIEAAYRKKRLIIVSDTSTTEFGSIAEKTDTKTILLLPLSYHSKVFGLLLMLSERQERFDKKRVNILKVFGYMASFAIKKSLLYVETKKALEIRNMFISMAAHELRTPLTSISGYIQLLYGKLANREGTEGKWINALYEENKRMMDLVKELLEVNRIHSGQIEFRWQEINLDSIIRQGVEEVAARYPHRQIVYTNSLSKDVRIVGDNERLVQVVDNLADNALKYSPGHKHVEVDLSEKQNMYILTVRDYGKGIDEKDLGNIFEGQHKGGSGEEGFGFGLYFVENVIRQHRGSIAVKSKLNKGTTMEVRLPKAKYDSQIKVPGV